MTDNRTSTADTVNWRNLIAACAAVCVFAFSLGEMFPLLALSMRAWGVSEAVIGLNTAMAPVGILLAGLVIPKLSHSFGAKPVAIFMAIATGILFLLYPTFPTLYAWFPLRLAQGIFVATLFALSEAWVLSNASGSARGRVVGIYATCISATFGVGPGVVAWTGIGGYLPFAIGAAVLLLATLPISQVSTDAANSADQPHVSIFAFFPKAPLLLIAIGVHAMFDGGMLGFLAVYGAQMGMSESVAALTITALSLGNVFFQIPIGWIADRTSKRTTMTACFFATALGLALLPFAIATVLVWPLVLVTGAAGFGIYTVGLSELGDRFRGSDLIAGTSAFSTMWGLGALLGSVVCGFAMDLFGPHGFPGVLFVVFAIFIAVQAVRSYRQAGRVAA
ncbi:MFS transporter [Dongia sp.]|uniref:MFS transporter n=1 Tax=Dongia sp. TaxID=1977262 RepID=UPI0035B06724